MSRWFRFYDDAINDPKILKLSDKLHRIWIGILCVASKNDGQLPPIYDIALMIRMKPEKLGDAIRSLIDAGLIDEEGSILSPHNWDKRQFKSDVSNERVKRYRERQCNVTVTPPDTEQIQNREEDTADAVSTSPKSYAFEDGIIRLTEKDLNKWQAAFSHLDLRAELIGLSAWATNELGPDRWFHGVKNALNKRNRTVRPAADHAAPSLQDWKKALA